MSSNSLRKLFRHLAWLLGRGGFESNLLGGVFALGHCEEGRAERQVYALRQPPHVQALSACSFSHGGSCKKCNHKQRREHYSSRHAATHHLHCPFFLLSCIATWNCVKSCVACCRWPSINTDNFFITTSHDQVGAELPSASDYHWLVKLSGTSIARIRIEALVQVSKEWVDHDLQERYSSIITDNLKLTSRLPANKRKNADWSLTLRHRQATLMLAVPETKRMQSTAATGNSKNRKIRLKKTQFPYVKDTENSADLYFQTFIQSPSTLLHTTQLSKTPWIEPVESQR